MTATFVGEFALLPSGDIASQVVLEVDNGRFVRVEPGGEVETGSERLDGLILPGFANVHSHAFHRALRGRTQGERGSFWTWRELMYDVAALLTPDNYVPLARACFAEMVLAGFTTVGEFHYLHHGHDGVPYSDPNEMGHALVSAARDAGIRLALLDTCYLAGGIGRDLEGMQRRFTDGDVERWAARASDLQHVYADAEDVVVGAAIHSVRAVPRDQVPTVAEWAQTSGAPLHVHLSEQPAENEACLAVYGTTPTGLLAEAGALHERTTAIHATHLLAEDIGLLAESDTAVCLCPTTERDLADGIGPAGRLHEAGVRLTLGTDSHAVIDPFEEARALELDERLVTMKRGYLPGRDLMQGLMAQGQVSLGVPDAGRLEVGARADLVAVDLRSVRTAGLATDAVADGIVFAASAPDVTDVVIGGRRVVQAREHVLGDVGSLLVDAIGAVLG